MIKNYFKIAFRHLWKNRLFTFLNLFGLTIGLASLMTLGFGVYAYYNADSFIQHKEELYTLKSVTSSGEAYDQTTYPLLGEIVNTVPDVAAATHIQSWNWPWLKVGDRELQKKTKYVDTSFFKVFTLPLKYGNPKTALQDTYDIVISEEVSRQFFGDKNPVGETIKADDSLSLTVQGVYKSISPYASLEFDVLLPTALLELNPGFKQGADWYNTFAYNYLRLQKGTNISNLENKVLEIAKRNYQDASELKKIGLVSFTEYRESYNPTVGKIIKGSIATIFFILLIVVINLLNINTSIIYGRHKEFAVRKIIGSGKRSLITQFCIENGVVVLASLLLAGFIFINVLLPEMNTIYGSRFGRIDFNLRNDYPVVILYFILGVIITLIVGITPTFKAISFPVASGIKGNVQHTKKNFFVRNTFITIQFALAIVFICVALVLNHQIKFMHNIPLGYNPNDVTVAKINLDFKDKQSANSYIQTLIGELEDNPYVQGVSTSGIIPTAYHNNYNTFYDPDTKSEVKLRKGHIGEGYLKTFDIPLIAGRSFDERLHTSEGNSIVINRKAMEALGWESIENKQLVEKGGEEEIYNVIGVSEDFHYQSMQQGIEPIMHYYNGKRGLGYNNSYLSLKIVPGKESLILDKLKEDFKQIPSRHEFTYEPLTSKINGQYKLLEGILNTVNYVAFLTIIISCLGMFGLISLIARKRVKEIGIRKTLGAGVGKITFLLSKDFMKLVLLACVIAFPITWLLMDKWLQDFAYRIDIKWWMFLLGGVIALFITGITVGFQSIKAAIANPIKSLRTE